MHIVIEGTDLPGRATRNHADVHIGVQRRGKAEWLDPQPGDATSVRWELACSASQHPNGALDALGPYVQGGPSARFVYLSWLDLDQAGEFVMFARIKLMFDAIPPEVAAATITADRLVGRLSLTDSMGRLVVASVRPPRIAWSTT